MMKTEQINIDLFDQVKKLQGIKRRYEAELLTMAQDRGEAVEIARIAIGAIETIYGHAQFCDQCHSFEIADQCRNELNGFDRLNSLDNK